MVTAAEPESATGPAPDNRWVLPIVVHVDRAAPPTAPDALAAVGTAVARFCLLAATLPEDDPRAVRFRTWRDVRIAKVVRRARRPEWRKAQALDGLRVEGPAEVLVGWPHHERDVPPEIRHAQIHGTDLAWPDDDPPVPPGPVLVVVLLVPMTTGKAAAQVGHAAQLAWERLGPGPWVDAGCPVVVQRAAPPAWGPPLVVVRDSGHTEVDPGTHTVSAWLR